MFLQIHYRIDQRGHLKAVGTDNPALGHVAVLDRTSPAYQPWILLWRETSRAGRWVMLATTFLAYTSPLWTDWTSTLIIFRVERECRKAASPRQPQGRRGEGFGIFQFCVSMLAFSGDFPDR